MKHMKLWGKKWGEYDQLEVLATQGNQLKRGVAWSSGKRNIKLELYCSRGVPVREL